MHQTDHCRPSSPARAWARRGPLGASPGSAGRSCSERLGSRGCQWRRGPARCRQRGAACAGAEACAHPEAQLQDPGSEPQQPFSLASSYAQGTLSLCRCAAPLLSAYACITGSAVTLMRARGQRFRPFPTIDLATSCCCWSHIALLHHLSCRS